PIADAVAFRDLDLGPARGGDQEGQGEGETAPEGRHKSPLTRRRVTPTLARDVPDVRTPCGQPPRATTWRAATRAGKAGGSPAKLSAGPIPRNSKVGWVGAAGRILGPRRCQGKTDFAKSRSFPRGPRREHMTCLCRDSRFTPAARRPAVAYGPLQLATRYV